jgi:hypothetical protein
MKQQILGLIVAVAASIVCAQSKPTNSTQTTNAGDTTKVTSTASIPVSKNVDVGVTSTTTYDQPGKGPNGPIPGNKSGSSTSTTTGPSVTIKY